MGRAPLLLLFLASGSLADELQWTRARADWYEPHEVTLAAEPPAGTASVGATALYYTGPWGDRKLLLALVAPQGPLAIDRDFDGDLADEEPLPLLEDGPWRKRVVEIEAPERVPLFFYRKADEKQPTLTIALLAHREGTVVLEGRVRPVMLFDGNHDLRFDDPAEDRAFLDVNADAVVDRRASTPDRIVPGRPFRVRGGSYVAALTGPGGRDIAFSASATPASETAPGWNPGTPPLPRVASPGPEDLDDLKRDLRAAQKEKVEGAGAGILLRIGALGTPEAFALLMRTYRTDKDEKRRAAAVEGMGYTNHAAQADEVREIARSEKEPAVRVAALDALRRMDAPGRGEIFARALGDAQNSDVYSAAARNLIYLGSPEGQRLLEEGVTKAPKDSFRYYAYYWVTRYRATAPSPALVLAATKQTDTRLRAVALSDASALGLGEARGLAFDIVRSEKRSRDPDLAAVVVLGAAGDPEAVAAMLPLAEEASPTLWARIVSLLRTLREDAPVATVIGGLDAPTPRVRALAADALRENPLAPVAPALLARLRQEREEPALAALARAAGEKRMREAAPIIAEALRRHAEDPDLEQAGLLALVRIGLAEGAATQILAERVASRNWQQRLAAADALADGGDPAGARLLISLLVDPAWQVRSAAAHGLGSLRPKEAVPALIAVLRKETHVRVRSSVADALFALTGQDFRDIPEAWERWWQEHGATFVVAAEVPERKPVAGGTTAAFYGIPVESSRVVFVLDTSGSMAYSPAAGAPTKLETAVREVRRVLDRLGREPQVNVVTFDSGVRRWTEGLPKLSPSKRRSLDEFLADLLADGATNLFGGLESALAIRDAEALYVLSDGAPTAGELTEDDEIFRAVTKLNRERRAAIHGVSLGGSSPLLRRLAKMTGGTYVER